VIINGRLLRAKQLYRLVIGKTISPQLCVNIRVKWQSWCIFIELEVECYYLLMINLIIYFCNRGIARFCDFGVESLLKIDFWLYLAYFRENRRKCGSLANRPCTCRRNSCGHPNNLRTDPAPQKTFLCHIPTIHLLYLIQLAGYALLNYGQVRGWNESRFADDSRSMNSQHYYCMANQTYKLKDAKEPSCVGSPHTLGFPFPSASYSYSYRYSFYFSFSPLPSCSCLFKRCHSPHPSPFQVPVINHGS
jgi:hypothetical protein